MSEAARRLQTLLSTGYFPKELPVAFTTHDFGQHAQLILDHWQQYGVFGKSLIPLTRRNSTSPWRGPRGTRRSRYRSNAYRYDLRPANIDVISMPKRGYERRNVHITHPVHQALLAKEITFNWREVHRWLARQTYSMDEIVLSEAHPRSLKGINFELHRAKKEYIASASDWLVTTDINRFYASIYTHSIAWAAYGKANVRANLSLYDGSLADRLDTLVRKCNSNQTIGIPTGPETSRILAETLSSRIDDEFRNASLGAETRPSRVDRLQDDWIIGTRTLDEAERSLAALVRIYRSYGLEINGTKTSIDHIIAQTGSYWISELSSFLSHSTEPLRGKRLREFLQMTIRLQATHATEPVVNYSMSVIEAQRFAPADMEALESFLLRAAVISPVSLDKICRVLVNISRTGARLSRRQVGNRFTELAERNLERGNTYEAAWLVYTLRGLRIPLESQYIADTVLSHAGAVMPIILLDMKAKGLFPRALPVADWESWIDDERVLSDWTWLLGYEGIRKGWLRDRSGVMRTPFFEIMDRLDVVFYDPRRNVRRSAREQELRLRQRQTDRAERLNMMEALRGVVHPDQVFDWMEQSPYERY